MLTAERRAWLLLLAACTDPRRIEDRSDEKLAPTEVEQVTARCYGDEVVVRARTAGWASEARLWVYEQDGAKTEFWQEYAVPSVGFTEPPEESCDLMSRTFVMPDEADSCDDLTFLLTVKYEDDCAIRGCVAWGRLPGAAIEDREEPAVVDERDDECHVTDACAENGDLLARVVEDPAADAEGCEGR